MLTNFINISESETQGVFDVFDNRTQFISFPHQFSTKGKYPFFSALLRKKFTFQFTIIFSLRKDFRPNSFCLRISRLFCAGIWNSTEFPAHLFDQSKDKLRYETIWLFVDFFLHHGLGGRCLDFACPAGNQLIRIQ